MEIKERSIISVAQELVSLKDRVIKTLENNNFRGALKEANEKMLESLYGCDRFLLRPYRTLNYKNGYTFNEEEQYRKLTNIVNDLDKNLLHIDLKEITTNKEVRACISRNFRNLNTWDPDYEQRDIEYRALALAHIDLRVLIRHNRFSNQNSIFYLAINENMILPYLKELIMNYIGPKGEWEITNYVVLTLLYTCAKYEKYLNTPENKEFSNLIKKVIRRYYKEEE